MYTEEDLTAIRAQQKKRWLILSIPAAVLLAAIVVSLILRMEWLTTTCTILLGCMIIFGYEMLIRPLHCYETHINNALHGRCRELEGEYVSLSEDISVVDGVRYRAMTIREEQQDDDPCDRMLYFDVTKPFPDIAAGRRVRVVFHDREVADITAL